jgi:multimeric flavodoxin WrbA
MGNEVIKKGGTMKLLGLTCGRKHHSSEILLKEALMAAKALGVDVSMIRLLDLDLKPCTGCLACVMGQAKGGSGECVIKDDWHFLNEHLLECDGLILSAPVFVLGAHGIVKLLADRLGPARDIAFRAHAKRVREEQGIAKGKGPDERSFKKRVGGHISVGGAITPNWVSLGLPLMHLITFPSGIKTVDQMQVMGAGRYMNVVLEPDFIERARRLGRNVAKAMQTPFSEVEWMGEETGTCPVCHCNLLTVGKKNPVECPICGIEGTLTIQDDEIVVSFSQEEINMARGTFAAAQEHVDEILGNLSAFLQRPDKDEIPKKVETYKTDSFEKDLVIPPPKKNGKG